METTTVKIIVNQKVPIETTVAFAFDTEAYTIVGIEIMVEIIWITVTIAKYAIIEPNTLCF